MIKKQTYEVHHFFFSYLSDLMIPNPSIKANYVFSINQFLFWSGSFLLDFAMAKRIDIGTGSTISLILYGSIICDGFIFVSKFTLGFSLPFPFIFYALITLILWFDTLSFLWKGS